MQRIEAIIKPSRRGDHRERGDGKIFVSSVSDALRIRTGERGAAAIT